MYHKRQYPLLIDSNPANGAKNLSFNGSTFTVELNEPVPIPRDAINVTVTVTDSTVWFVTPNIVTGSNDQFIIYDGLSTTTYVLTIPQGLYSWSQLGAMITTQLLNVGAVGDEVRLGSNLSTNKVTLTFKNIGSYADFTDATYPRNCRGILGFNDGQTTPTTVGDETLFGDVRAQFNTLDYILLGSDICNRGIRFDDRWLNILAKIPINTTPGKQIRYQPYIPPLVPAEKLKGGNTSQFTFYLMDQTGQRLNTADEYWSAILLIEWEEKT